MGELIMALLSGGWLVVVGIFIRIGLERNRKKALKAESSEAGKERRQ
jgi:hypothetical protein